MLSLNTNLIALTAQRHWAATASALARVTERLSSGLRINSARDDAAGLAISQRLMAQIRGTDVAVRNANDAISRAQVAESATGSVVDALQRMNELAVQAANGSLTTDDRALLEIEFDELQEEIASLVADTEYDGSALLNNASSIAIQVGPNAGQTVTMTNTNLSSMSTTVGALSVAGATTASASAAITALETALTTATSAQASWGAIQNRFDSVVSLLQSSSTTLSAARGRIVDADFATETAQRARLLVLQDSAVAMLAQANAQPQRVLSLLLN